MKIGLIGTGKMGQAVAALLENSDSHRVTKMLNSRQPLIKSALTEVNVIIDFSTASALRENVQIALSAGCPFVTGTTNWESELPQIRQMVESQKGSFLHAANFSIGVMLFRKLTEFAAQISGVFGEYDISVHEIHHRQKADSPSGTAKMLANAILAAHPRKSEIHSGNHNGAVPENVLCVSSQRVGSVPGTHQIFIDSPADAIELSHIARGRAGFATGAIRAAEWLTGRSGFFSIDDMFSDILNEVKSTY